MTTKDLRLGSTAKAKAVHANGAPERIKPDHVHKEISPAMAAHPFGGTGTHRAIDHYARRHAPFSVASGKITELRRGRECEEVRLRTQAPPEGNASAA